MRADEILALATQAGIGLGTSVLDLCCGVAGPGRHITSRLGCRYLGIDASAAAIAIARERAAGLDCRFEVAQIPPVPAAAVDVVLLLETMLAFADKDALLQSVSASLAPGGRFAFTVEEGAPLSASERARMPHADTVWLVPVHDLRDSLEQVGLRVRWQQECTRAHEHTAGALLDAFSADVEAIAAHLGRRALEELLAAHRLWCDWMRDGRVRKLAVVAEKVPADGPGQPAPPTCTSG